MNIESRLISFSDDIGLLFFYLLIPMPNTMKIPLMFAEAEIKVLPYAVDSALRPDIVRIWLGMGCHQLHGFSKNFVADAGINFHTFDLSNAAHKLLFEKIFYGIIRRGAPGTLALHLDPEDAVFIQIQNLDVSAMGRQLWPDKQIQDGFHIFAELFIHLADLLFVMALRSPDGIRVAFFLVLAKEREAWSTHLIWAIK
jgi:hypothetical protein